GATGRGLGEVVTPAGLVVDDRDDARCAGAERVLCRRVREAARAQGADIGCRAVRRAADLVEPAAVGAEEGPGRAVRGHAGRATRGVDVTGPGSRGGSALLAHTELRQNHADEYCEQKRRTSEEYLGLTHCGLPMIVRY